MKRVKHPDYQAPLSEVAEEICNQVFAASEDLQFPEPVDWESGNQDWWNA